MNDSETGLIPMYRILVLSVPEDPAEFTPILIEHLNLNKVDARILQRNLPGLIPTPLPKERVDAFCKKLHDLEGYAVSLLADEIPSLDRPIELHHAGCSDDGLAMYDLDGNISETIPPDDLELLSLGALPTEQSRREVDFEPPLHTSTGPKGSNLDLPAMMGAEAYLIAENPYRVYHINHNEMNYEYLKDRKSTSATANFRQFADDLIAMSEGLYLTPASRAFTNHGLLSQYQFSTPEAFRRMTLFHLLICRQMHQQ